ncbi:MAG: hypothetical protein ACXU89_18345 [Xanthobacteraceae bacterium]
MTKDSSSRSTPHWRYPWVRPVTAKVCPHCDASNHVPRERLRDGAKCGSCHRRLFERRPAALNSAARFDKHARHSDIPLLVDFWAA